MDCKGFDFVDYEWLFYGLLLKKVFLFCVCEGFYCLEDKYVFDGGIVLGLCLFVGFFFEYLL